MTIKDVAFKKSSASTGESAETLPLRKGAHVGGTVGSRGDNVGILVGGRTGLVVGLSLRIRAGPAGVGGGEREATSALDGKEVGQTLELNTGPQVGRDELEVAGLGVGNACDGSGVGRTLEIGTGRGDGGGEGEMGPGVGGEVCRCSDIGLGLTLGTGVGNEKGGSDGEGAGSVVGLREKGGSIRNSETRSVPEQAFDAPWSRGQGPRPSLPGPSIHCMFVDPPPQ